MTTTSIQSGTVFSYDGQTLKAQNSGSPWALTETDGGALQFKVTPGDQWSADPTIKNRTEVAVLGRSVADGTPIDVAYRFTVAPGAGSNAIIGQFHQDENTNGIAPPLAIGLIDDKMNVTVGYVGSSGVQTTQTIFTDTSPITRGSAYAMDIKVTFGTNGGGHVVVSRDGRTIAQYDGPLGWSSSESLYWKEGIYAQTADQNLAVTYDDLSIATGAPGPLPTAPDRSRQYSTYDSKGTKLSTVQTDGVGATRTTSFDAAGIVTKTVQIDRDGSQSIFDYGIKGQTYVSDRRLYDAAGTLTELDTYDASGTRLEADTYAVAGQNYTAARKTYDKSGALVTATYVNKDHSTTANSYAAGTLTKAAFVAADGTQTVYDYGIRGQGYVSDRRTYNAAGTLTELDTYDAKGTRLEADTYAVTGQSYTSARQTYDATGTLVAAVYNNTNGSTTTKGYAAGVLTRALTRGADGSQSIDDYGIKGQAYVSDRRLYDAAGTLTEFDTYNAAGIKLEADTYAVAGQSYTAARQSYDGTGKLVSAIFNNKDGSITTDSYAGGTLTKALTRQADGSQTVYDYGIKGQGYVSDRRVYDAAGTLTELDTYDAAGAKLEADTYAVTGRSYTSARQTYGGSGKLVSAVYINKDGSTTTDSYAAGTLTKALTRGADGSQTVYDYGIKGQSYVSDRRLYDAGGTLTEFDAIGADGSMQVQASAPRLTLAGGSGDDSFRSAGSDTFVFTDHFGHDSISNFVTGSGVGHDVLRLADPGGMNFLNLSIQQHGSDTVITVDPQDTITLGHVVAKTLTASDFSFH